MCTRGNHAVAHEFTALIIYYILYFIYLEGIHDTCPMDQWSPSHMGKMVKPSLSPVVRTIPECIAALIIDCITND